MMRPRLIYHTEDYTNFGQAWVLPLVQKHFDFVRIDQTTVQPGDIIFTTYQTARQPRPWYTQYQQAGHRLIVEHLVDSDVDTASRRINGALELRNGSWMWYREVLNYTWVGYNQYRPRPCVDRCFLLLMNKHRDHRDRILQDLGPLLPNALYSYVDRGINIDAEDVRDSSRDNIYWLWYFNPDWYNRTAFSVVAESWMRTDAWVQHPEFPNYRTEVSEKIYKPMAYRHPQIVYGSEGTLKYLKRNGFETWDNLWDESYDSVLSDADRFAAVTATVFDAVAHHSAGQWDSLTQQKLQHNAERFWDLNLVQKKFEEEIVRDIMEYISK